MILPIDTVLPAARLDGPACRRSSRHWPSAARRGELRPARAIGYCLVSSSLPAVGLTIQTRSAFRAHAAAVTGIVLAAVVILEVIDPLLSQQFESEMWHRD
jgi:hypothetical protein